MNVAYIQLFAHRSGGTGLVFRCFSGLRWGRPRRGAAAKTRVSAVAGQAQERERGRSYIELGPIRQCVSFVWGPSRKIQQEGKPRTIFGGSSAWKRLLPRARGIQFLPKGGWGGNPFQCGLSLGAGNANPDPFGSGNGKRYLAAI